MKLLEEYQRHLERKEITSDTAQRQVIELLADLQQKIDKPKSLLRKKALARGLYLWGGVGRGKSMLMDLFFSTLNEKKKRRVHFHAFMLEVHEALRRATLPEVAETIAENTRVLCFDEFQVTNIADAMILARLFTPLFEEGVVVIATSNRPPEELYYQGLQRERFLPFIDLLNEKLDVMKLDSPTDYRLQQIKNLSTVYFTPLGKKANQFMEESFAALIHHAEAEACTLHAQGRELLVKKMRGKVAWFSFDELCNTARGAADYLEIATEFTTVLLSNIPAMGKESRNQAARFVSLIDALYEHRVKLICSAETSADKLYPVGDGSFEFQRTVSRLIEMQGEKYLAKAHI